MKPRFEKRSFFTVAAGDTLLLERHEGIRASHGRSISERSGLERYLELVLSGLTVFVCLMLISKGFSSAVDMNNVGASGSKTQMKCCFCLV